MNSTCINLQLVPELQHDLDGMGGYDDEDNDPMVNVQNWSKIAFPPNVWLIFWITFPPDVWEASENFKNQKSLNFFAAKDQSGFLPMYSSSLLHTNTAAEYARDTEPPYQGTRAQHHAVDEGEISWAGARGERVGEREDGW